MNILDARITWNTDHGCPATLQLLVDGVPARSELRFREHTGIWYAEKDGYAEYFAWRGPGNEGGYSGQCFDITTVDGEHITLKGPYSSRAGCVNLRGLGPVVDAQLTTDPERWTRGSPNRRRAITLTTAKQAIDRIPGASHLEQRHQFSNEEPYWIPVRENGGDV